MHAVHQHCLHTHTLLPNQHLLCYLSLAVDGFNVVALKPGSVTELLLTDSAGQQVRTFADKEGWFTVRDVAPGSYVLTTHNPMFVYPEVSMARLVEEGSSSSSSGVLERLSPQVCRCSRGCQVSTSTGTNAPPTHVLPLCVCVLQLYVDVTAKSGLARASYVFNKQQVGAAAGRRRASRVVKQHAATMPAVLFDGRY